MTPEETDAIRNLIQGEIAAKLDRAVETIATEMSLLRQELTSRLDSLSRQMDRHSEDFHTVQISLANLNRWADRFDKDEIALAANYHAHERTIRDLLRRVQALEAKPQ